MALLEASDAREAAGGLSREADALGGVRGLVLGWCLWLLASWLLTLTVAATVPAVRWMVYASMTGMLLVWPVVRLSQGRGGRGAVGATLGEWLSLNAVWQAVIWPLQLIAGWGLWQTATLDAAMLSWSLLVGLAVAWGRWVGSGVARSLAMLGCVAVVFGAGVVRPWVSGVGMQWSPVAALWALTEKPADFELGGLAAAVGTVAAAAVLGWAVLLGWGVFAGRARASGTGMLK